MAYDSQCERIRFVSRKESFVFAVFGRAHGQNETSAFAICEGSPGKSRIFGRGPGEELHHEGR
jgi:hypothetical protein